MSPLLGVDTLRNQEGRQVRRDHSTVVGRASNLLVRDLPFAEPEEIAAAAVFLASGEAAMVNGADLLVDGGYTVR